MQEAVSNMARFFAPISSKELKSKIEKELHDEIGLNYNLIQKKLGKDLKVKFDFENFDYTSTHYSNSLLGYKVLPNKMWYLGCSAGGDWESPVFFIIYWDGNKLRGYIPTKGNTWNRTTKEAYGNDEEADLKEARKIWPGIEDTEYADFSWDMKLIKEDIMERILPKSYKSTNKIKEPKIKSMKQRIEELVFYGTGDEAYELFCQTCSYCYSLRGLGENDKSEVVYQWAREMAIASKCDAEYRGCLDDHQNGVWC